MIWDDFTSPAYKLETTNAASSVMRNLYCETIEKGERKGKNRIVGIPGLKTFATLAGGPMRALLSIDSGNRLFAIAGGTVYEVFANGTSQALVGAIAMDSHPALMSTNGFQIAISSGGYLYLANGGSPAGTVQPITFLAADGGGAVQAGTLTFMDQYFIVDQINSKTIFISNLAPNGNLWDPGDTAQKEGYSDNIARVYCTNEQLWLFGFDTTEVWQDTGALFPFQRIQGALMSIGCTAPYSVASYLGILFWFWNGSVYYSPSLTPQRISDYGVEQAIKSYGNVADAEGYCYTSGGHIFYVLTFPSVGRTWVYDLSLQAWHERLFWQNGQWQQYRARVYARAFNMDLVGDPLTGTIYQMDRLTYTDAGGVPLRRERVCPYIQEEEKMLRHNRLTVDVDTGVGLSVAADQPGYDPQMIMRYSDDRGKTWSNERQASMGMLGMDKTRVIYRQNGSSRLGKAYEIVVSDPVPVSINGAYLELGTRETGR